MKQWPDTNFLYLSLKNRVYEDFFIKNVFQKFTSLLVFLKCFFRSGNFISGTHFRPGNFVNPSKCLKAEKNTFLLVIICHAELRCRFHVLCCPELWYLLGEFYQTTWTFQTVISSQNYQILDLQNFPLWTVFSWENFPLENYFICSLFSQKFDIIKNNLTRLDQYF